MESLQSSLRGLTEWDRWIFLRNFHNVFSIFLSLSGILEDLNCKLLFLSIVLFLSWDLPLPHNLLKISSVEEFLAVILKQRAVYECCQVFQQH